MGKIYNVFKRVGIGIVVSQFDLSERELGVKGNWSFQQPNISKSEELQYVISWIGNN